MHAATRVLVRFNHSLKRTGQGYMLLCATAVGVVGGYAAIAFRWLIHALQGAIWPQDVFTSAWIETLPWYWIVLTPAVGGLIAGTITYRFAPEAGGHGVPEVIEAMALRGGRLRARTVIAKFFASSVTIASGGSVGREGPIVQIAAAASSGMGQFLHLSPRRLRTLVGCGAAAGISATFNAPLAGALFAVEILMGDFGVPQFSPIVVSAVIATTVSRYHLGNVPTFSIPPHALNHPFELVGYVVLGVIVAVMAVAFIRTLDVMEDTSDGLALPVPLKAAVGGALVGGIALVYPGVLGVGYEEINHALLGTSAGTYLAVLVGAKLLAVCITLASGGSGGVFAPSLFMGAAAGGAVGAAVESMLGAGSIHPGAFALVGMGAMVAATTHAPLTAMLVIFELTVDYRIILPLMLSCVIGSMLAARLHHDSIYTSKLTRRGIRIRGGRVMNVLARFTASSLMNRDPVTVGPDARLSSMLELLLARESGCLYVVDATGAFRGTVTMDALRPLLANAGAMEDLIVASDVATSEGPRARPADTLDTVLGRLAAGYRDEIPVLEDGRLIGAVRTEDILARYRRELLRREMAEGITVSLAHTHEEAVRYCIGDFTVAEQSAPRRFWGRTLGELEFRRNLGLNVLLVRRGSDDGDDDAHPEMPDATCRIEKGDRLVVFGRNDDVERLLGRDRRAQPPVA